MFKSSSIFREVFYQSRIPQMVSTLNFSHIWVNQALCEFTGYTMEEWESLEIQDVTHPDDYEKDVKLLSEMNEGKRQEYFLEKRYLCKNGVLKFGILNVSLIQDESTGERFLLRQIQDITDKIKIGYSLRENEKKYRLLAENSSDIINLHDRDGQYLYVSPSVTTLLGYDPHEITGQSPYDYIHPDDVPIIEKYHKKILIDHEPVLVTYRSKKKDGSYIWLETTIKAVENSDEFISVSRDIQHRIETDRLLRRSEKLAVVGQLAAAVAHEIRNPLTPIKGFIQLFKDTKTVNEKYVDIVLDELDRVETIISEFLAMAKPHHERMEIIHVESLVENIVELMGTEALMNNKEIVFTGSDTCPKIQGDANSIKQVIVNIIQNGLDAIDEKGTVDVRVIPFEENICIQVEDNGCGIPQERLSKLGEPFYSTKEKGTGLGLMTSFNIIDQHKGKVEVQSEMDEGTTVTIFLPLYE
ncbi:PAS domain-containing sensor histidine kinase [Falsibacillus albus]|uniref:histidine kinase n=1 Tax=Falsibacillus albus TaxID=2478915 RepID=A0A3L7K660_9BACI|nr:PAS domain S-box protein [Falsibacillus albus]RLQ96192.1 PAS domain S-box protein [Falsibacillus albus]